MDNCPCLESIIQAAQPHLSCVCDVKEAGGDMYYRLNDRRVRLILSLFPRVLCAPPCFTAGCCLLQCSKYCGQESTAIFDVSGG